MCEPNDTTPCLVIIPGRLSHTGRDRYKVVAIDRCIAPLVRRLNIMGLYTANCCCGHGKASGSIVFHNGSELCIEHVQSALRIPSRRPLRRRWKKP